MSKSDLIEAYRGQAADALAEAAKDTGARKFVDQLRRKALDVAALARERALDLGDQARERAADLGGRARERAMDEVATRRSSAADVLEDWADVVRPDAHRRRRQIAMVGGSGLALTAAVGLGVALGFVVSRELKKRAARKTADAKAEPAGAPAQIPAAPATTGRASKARAPGPSEAPAADGTAFPTSH
jgi:hypothetical protein